jgi:hypothetical protein
MRLNTQKRDVGHTADFLLIPIGRYILATKDVVPRIA